MSRVKVRIGLAVDSEGRWSALGWSFSKTPTEFFDHISDDLNETVKEYWLEAWVELPSEKDREHISARATAKS